MVLTMCSILTFIGITGGKFVLGYVQILSSTLLISIIIFLSITTLFLIVSCFRIRNKYNKVAFNAEVEKMALLNHFEHLVKYANDIILLANEDMHIVDANEKAIETYKYSKLEMLNLPMEGIVATEDHNRYIEHIKKLDLHGSYIRDALHRKKDGTVFHVEVSTRLFVVENKKYYQAIIRDISEKKGMEQQLTRNQKRLIRAEHVAGFGNWEYDLKRKIFYPSKGAKVIFGISNSVDFITLEEVRMFALPECRKLLDVSIANLIEKDMPYNVEYKILRPSDGKIIDIHSIAEFDTERKIIFGVIQDVTQLKQAEKELKLAKQKAEESDNLKSAFLANMSHEIRTPMNGIVGFSEMLTKKNISDEKRVHYADLICQSTQQLLSIVDDILDLSKIETGQIILFKQNVEVNKLINEILSFFKAKAEEKGLSLIFNELTTYKNTLVLTDKARLMQIISNLVANAVKFTLNGYVKTGFHITNGFIEFYVKDSGIGIAPENHQKIFERFRQAEIDIARNFGGAGLGLAITKNLVELLGGEIWLTSEINKGSTFYFTIPYVVPHIKLVEAEKEAEKSAIITDSLTILFAEDEIINYLYVEEVFSDQPITLLHAKNGAEALEMFKNHPEIDLILMDIKMPIMNGHEATKKIREINPSIAIIAITAYAMTEDKESALKSGCTDYLAKPMKSEELLKMIRKYTSLITK